MAVSSKFKGKVQGKIKAVGPQLGKPLTEQKVTQPQSGGWGAGPSTAMPAGGWKSTTTTKGDRSVSSPQWITDSKGNISGLRLPGGKDYLGSAADMRKIMERYNRNRPVEEEPGILSEYMAKEEEEERLKELTDKQTAEMAALMGQMDTSQLLPESERLIQSGQAVANRFTSVAGLPNLTFENDPLGRPVGLMLGLTFKGISLLPQGVGTGINSMLFGDYEATIGELKGDIDDYEKNTKILLTNVRDGLDPDIALALMDKMQASLLQKYAQASKLTEDNPDMIREGIDLMGDQEASRIVMLSRRQMVERYKVTRNPADITYEPMTSSLTTEPETPETAIQ